MSEDVCMSRQMHKDICDQLHSEIARVKVDKARESYNRASLALDYAQVQCRLALVRSQADPIEDCINKHCNIDRSSDQYKQIRNAILGVVYWIQSGRYNE